MGPVKPGLHQRMQRALERYEEREKRRRPTYREMAQEAAETYGVEEGASIPTVGRHIKDPGQKPIPELVAAFAKILGVREEFLFDGEEPIDLEELHRTRRDAAAAATLANQVETAFPLDEAAQALWAKAIRRWVALPAHQFRDEDRRVVGPPAPEEVSDTLRRIVIDVTSRLPRRMWNDEDRNDYVAALINALMHGIQKDSGGDPRGFTVLLPEGGMYRSVKIEGDLNPSEDEETHDG